MLSLRGWGPESFRLAAPDFHLLARHAVMVERMLPLYSEAQAALGVELGGMPQEAKGVAAQRKIAAGDILASLTPVLFPDDDDG